MWIHWFDCEMSTWRHVHSLAGTCLLRTAEPTFASLPRSREIALIIFPCSFPISFREMGNESGEGNCWSVRTGEWGKREERRVVGAVFDGVKEGQGASLHSMPLLFWEGRKDGESVHWRSNDDRTTGSRSNHHICSYPQTLFAVKVV